MKTIIKKSLIFIVLALCLAATLSLLHSIVLDIYSCYIFETESIWVNTDAEIELSVIQNEALNSHSIIGKYKGNDICRSHFRYTDAVTGEFCFDGTVEIIGFNKMSLKLDYVEDEYSFVEDAETIILRRKDG